MTQFIKEAGSHIFDDPTIESLYEKGKNPLWQYSVTTSGIEVLVCPIFLEKRLDKNNDFQYSWLYRVTINNNSDDDIKIKNRYWKIIEENGYLIEVFGKGVVGKTPDIAKGDKFEYTSGVNLNCKSGVMFGYYEIEKTGASTMKQIDIPFFSLDSKEQQDMPN